MLVGCVTLFPYPCRAGNYMYEVMSIQNRCEESVKRKKNSSIFCWVAGALDWMVVKFEGGLSH